MGNYRNWVCALAILTMTGTAQAQDVRVPTSGNSPFGTPLYRAPVPNRTVDLPPGARQGMDYYYGWGAGGYGYGMGTQRFGDQSYDQGQVPGYETTRRNRDHRGYDNDPFNYNSSNSRSRSQRRR